METGRKRLVELSGTARDPAKARAHMLRGTLFAMAAEANGIE